MRASAVGVVASTNSTSREEIKQALNVLNLLVLDLVHKMPPSLLLRLQKVNFDLLLFVLFIFIVYIYILIIFMFDCFNLSFIFYFQIFHYFHIISGRSPEFHECEG